MIYDGFCLALAQQNQLCYHFSQTMAVPIVQSRSWVMDIWQCEICISRNSLQLSSPQILTCGLPCIRHTDTKPILDDVDLIEYQLLPAYGLGQCLLHSPSRCHKLDLLRLVLHLQVALQLVLVQEFLDEALGVVFGQDLLYAGVHDQVDADSHDSHDDKNIQGRTGELIKRDIREMEMGLMVLLDNIKEGGGLDDGQAGYPLFVLIYLLQDTQIMLRHSVLLLFFILFTAHCLITIQQYETLQSSNPSSLLNDLDIDHHHQNFPSIQKLIFLTPWNKKGFEYTLKYSHKIDYVSPCWYILKLSKTNRPIFQNQHNYDADFALKIKQKGVKLVPRVYLQGNDINFIQNIGSDRSKFQETISLIQRVIRQKQLDGIVWDSPFNFFEKSRHQVNNFIAEFVKSIRGRIGSKLIMFNMGNPMNHMNSLEMGLINSLPVDYLLVQNYDSGDDYLQMVEKSLLWGRNLNKSIKMMLMLPFFSVKVKVGSLSTEEAVRSLKRMGVQRAEVAKGMCKFTQNKTKRVFLIPCFTYFKKVFTLAQASNAAVGFWQGGNGLENYYKFL